MGKRKKSALMLMAAVLLAASTVLAACGSGGGKQSSAGKESSEAKSSDAAKDSQSTAEASTPEDEEREYVELTWYLPLGSATSIGGTGAEQVVEAVNEYTVEKLNTYVDIHFLNYSDYEETVPTMVSAGKDIDIVFTGGTNSLDFLTYAKAGAFLPLEDYIDEYLPGVKAQLPDYAWDAFTVDGHVYCVPTNKDLADRKDIVYNQTMLDDLDLTFPESYDTMWDLIPFFYELREAFDEKYPEKAGQVLITGTPRVSAYYYYESIVSDMVVANIPGLLGFEGMGDGETAFCIYYTDEYRDLCKKDRQYIKDRIFPNQEEDQDRDHVRYNAGEIFSNNIGNGLLFWDEESTLPAMKSALAVSDTAVSSTGYIRAGANAISATCKYPERALEFLELVNNDQYLGTVLRFGPEGDGWTDEDNDGVVEPGALNQDRENMTNRFWWNWYGWQMGSITACKVPPGNPANFGEAVEEFNKNAISVANMGFSFDPEPVTNEIAACSNVVSEYDVEDGKSDDVDERVDEFIQKLKDNGMDKIVEEAQRQLDEWRSANGMPTKQ